MVPAFLAPVASLAPSDAGGGNGSDQRNSRVPLRMDRQLEDLWCWAAVTQCIERWKGQEVDQSEVASFHIDPVSPRLVCVHPLAAHESDQICSGQGCDGSSGCGDAHSLRAVLTERQRLSKAAADPPSFDLIAQTIDSGRPVPVRIRWNEREGHFVTVWSYRVDAAGTQWVDVLDPLLGVVGGPADSVPLRFRDFQQRYPSTGGDVGAPNWYYELIQ